jgi:hypothetical protein
MSTKGDQQRVRRGQQYWILIIVGYVTPETVRWTTSQNDSIVSNLNHYQSLSKRSPCDFYYLRYLGR